MSDISKDLHAIAKKYARSKNSIDIVTSSILYYMITFLVTGDLESIKKFYGACSQIALHTNNKSDEYHVFQNMMKKDQTENL